MKRATGSGRCIRWRGVVGTVVVGVSAPILSLAIWHDLNERYHMRKTRSFRFLALMLLALLSLAFATGTMGARIPDRSELQLKALFLTGVSPHDLCMTDDGQTHKHEAQCSLCIVFGPSSMTGCDLIETDALYLGQVILPQIRRAAWHRRDPAIPSRGPPKIFSATL